MQTTTHDWLTKKVTPTSDGEKKNMTATGIPIKSANGHYTAAFRKFCLDQIASGKENAPSLSAKYGVHTTTVYDWQRDTGSQEVEPKEGKKSYLSKAQIAELQHLYRTGMSRDAIARMLNVRYSQVCSWCKGLEQDLVGKSSPVIAPKIEEEEIKVRAAPPKKDVLDAELQWKSDLFAILLNRLRPHCDDEGKKLIDNFRQMANLV